MDDGASRDGLGVWVGKWSIIVDREFAVAENATTGKRYTAAVTKVAGVYSPGGVWSDGLHGSIDAVPLAVRQKARALAKKLR